MRRVRGQRGATLVEGAIIGPLFFLFLFAILEFGLLFRSYLSVSSAARDGARAASAADVPGFADWNVLQAVRRGGIGIDVSAIERVVVFKGSDSAGFDSVVPTSCLTGSSGVSGLCNVYRSSDLGLTRSAFGLGSFTSKSYWSGEDRDANLFEGTDFVGVYVETSHEAITGLLGTDRTVASTTVMRIEPQDAIEEDDG